MNTLDGAKILVIAWWLHSIFFTRDTHKLILPAQFSLTRSHPSIQTSPRSTQPSFPRTHCDCDSCLFVQSFEYFVSSLKRVLLIFLSQLYPWCMTWSQSINMKWLYLSLFWFTVLIFKGFRIYRTILSVHIK